MILGPRPHNYSQELRGGVKVKAIEELNCLPGSLFHSQMVIKPKVKKVHLLLAVMYKLCMHACLRIHAFLGVRATLLPSRKMRIRTWTNINVGGQRGWSTVIVSFTHYTGELDFDFRFI